MSIVPNNNFSVLPWYTSLQEQNARRWWAYGRVYPLFVPALKLLPFQVMRNALTRPIWGDTKGDELSYTYGLQGRYMYIEDGEAIIERILPAGRSSLTQYEIPEGVPKVFVEYLPWVSISGEPCNAAFFDEEMNCLAAHDVDDGSGGVVSTSFNVPAGTKWLIVQRAPTPYADTVAVYQPVITGYETTPVSSFDIYTKDGSLVGQYITEITDSGLTVKPFSSEGYDVIVFRGLLPFLQTFPNGQYYAVMSDGTNTWYSEIFTAVNDIEPYLKIEWWDEEDFVMDAGTIVYDGYFKNTLYLPSDLAKPEYEFEEEGENRDGYFFPIKQISQKLYHFRFLAPEYLLDVIRFIRMSDHILITYRGRTYIPDTFLVTPEWEGNGDIANVEAEFTTYTVAKKIGLGYLRAQRGDFNNDFNQDYDT